MGRNARVRRGWTDVKPQAAMPLQIRETKTLERLRTKMRLIRTMAEFEFMIEDATTDNRGAIRKLLEPMLRPGLPCCGAGALEQASGKPQHHSLRCPTKRLVVLQ